jgi:hypothetical protein
MDLNRSGRIESLCSLFCLFVCPPKSLRAATESAAKLLGQMGLVGEAAFRSDIGHRASFLCQQQPLGVSQPAAQKVLVRRQTNERVEEPAEMERTQASDTRYFITGHPRGEVCLYEYGGVARPGYRPRAAAGQFAKPRR